MYKKHVGITTGFGLKTLFNDIVRLTDVRSTVPFTWTCVLLRTSSRGGKVTFGAHVAAND